LKIRFGYEKDCKNGIEIIHQFILSTCLANAHLEGTAAHRIGRIQTLKKHNQKNIMFCEVSKIQKSLMESKTRKDTIPESLHKTVSL